MKYRQFGRLNWEASALGFGCMRLPVNCGDGGKINRPLAVKMIRYAIDHGVNYVDTAYNYHQGESEVLVGEALKDGYREKVKIATKMPTWLVHSQRDMDRYLSEQHNRLCTNYVDFYLLHGLNQKQWDKVRKLDVTAWLGRKLDEGRIKHVGFSFHDDFDALKNIIDGYAGWTFCQIQYNYMDADNQAGTRGLEYAASKGLGIVVMEPIAGGKLATTPPKEIQSLWETAEVKKTPAEWALRWVWNHPQVSVVLSGMSTIDQVVENVEIASHSNPCDMTENELVLVELVKQKYKEMGFIKCSGCGYCMPCPEGVNIPAILSFYNEYNMTEKAKDIKGKYWDHITPKSQARKCVRCARCEDICPQKIPVKNVLLEAALIFESGHGEISYYPKRVLSLIRASLRKTLNQAKRSKKLE